SDGAQSSRVPVPLSEDPYEAIRQAYLMGMDIKSEPLGDLFETKTPESPHTVASPTLLPDSTPPTCRTEETACMAVCVPHVMSPGLSSSIAEVVVMSNSAFREEEDEEVEKSSDFDSESKDTEDEGLTARDEGPTTEDEGLAARDGGPEIRVKSLGLGGDETMPEGQQRTASVVETAIAPSIVPSPISSPIISLTIPLPVASPATPEADGFLTKLGSGEGESPRNLFPPLDNPELTIRRRSRTDPTLLNNSEMAAEGPGDLPVPDLRTMEELCQPSLNGRGGPITLIAIQATNFGLKNDMSIKVNEITNDALCLYLFPHSLTHHATAWFDRLPRNSINTFEQMAKMFLGKYFPPFMVTKLKNEIINFRQCSDESLFEAWERYKLSIDRCPNHNMLPVTQIDTFYNGLTLRHRDTINVAARGTFMKRRPEECYDLIENMTAQHNDWDTSAQRSESSSSITSSFDTEISALKAKMAEINKNLMRVLQVNQQVKAVTLNCETCGGPHSFSDCLATVGNIQNGANQGQNQPPAYQVPAYQALVYQAPVHQPQIPQPQVVTTNEFTNFMMVNDATLKNMQTNMTSLKNSNLELKNMFGQFMKMNTASSSSSGTLPSNTLTNPKEDLKGITTRRGTAYPGPTIPTTSFSPVVEHKTEATKDMVHPTNNGSTEDVQPPVVPTESPTLNSEPVTSPIIEPVASPVSAPRPNQIPSIPYPSRLQDQKLRDKANDQREKIFQIFKDLNFNISFADALIMMPKRSFLKIERALIDVFEGERTLRVGKEAITFNLNQTSRYSASYNDMMVSRIDVIDMACEEYSQEVLSFFDVIASDNPTPYYDSIVSTTSPTLTPFENSDFLLEEVDAFLALKYDPNSPEVDQSYLDIEGDILLLEAFLNDDPSLPPPNQGNYLPGVRKELKIYEAKSDKSLIDEAPERVCIDYRKLNEATHKGHFSLPFMDQMLERLAGNQYYCFLNGFSGYFQIPIDSKDQEKTTFTCPYRMFAYRRMPFGLCNAPGTFQRCMMAIFHDMIEKTMEVFMDDFSVFGNSFQSCLSHLEKILKRCEETNLCLNWEKSHFMVKERIVLGHKISKEGIEIDKAKVDVISKLPHPTTVKGAENLATDHLSRLENPHQNMLDRKEINESFPLKTLNLVSTRGNSSTPWFADFANYHAENSIVKGMSS
nr:reverse transcriptase domain-containing protein [Tanacetum cinerariifolium]GEX35273.1 reverse transcriptase domain-containing protein [Tanacetum cinerariifolium]